METLVTGSHRNLPRTELSYVGGALRVPLPRIAVVSPRRPDKRVLLIGDRVAITLDNLDAVFANLLQFTGFTPDQVSKRALITRIISQDGSSLAELLLEKGHELFGMTRRARAPIGADIRPARVAPDRDGALIPVNE